MQRDYILRMIEQAAAILRAVLARVLERGADSTQVARDLQRAAHLGGLDLELLHLCDTSGLLHMVAPGGEPEPGRTWLAAEVLFLDGLAAQRQGRPELAMESLAKARLLFGFLAPTVVLPTGFPEASQRMREIDEYLQKLTAEDEG